ncbi:hypothetical protein B0H13DRAFT_1861567 [Mycena leptocephala]|nr:hypothetical protein B0H13DRAFT_1861567 [Mycena leptocephala]
MSALSPWTCNLQPDQRSTVLPAVHMGEYVHAIWANVGLPFLQIPEVTDIVPEGETNFTLANKHVAIIDIPQVESRLGIKNLEAWKSIVVHGDIIAQPTLQVNVSRVRRRMIAERSWGINYNYVTNHSSIGCLKSTEWYTFDEATTGRVNIFSPANLGTANLGISLKFSPVYFFGKNSSETLYFSAKRAEWGPTKPVIIRIGVGEKETTGGSTFGLEGECVLRVKINSGPD